MTDIPDRHVNCLLYAKQINNQITKEEFTMYTKRFSSWPKFLDEFAPYTYGKQQTSGFTSRPAVNIKENAEDFELEIAAPGLKKDDFKVTVEEGVLTISCEKEEQSQEAYLKREFGYGKFQRAFELGETINQEDINAKYENGILRLVLAKKEEAKPKPAKDIAIA